MAYTAIDDSRSVIQHYGKKGMKWRKNRDPEMMRQYNEYDIATGKELDDDYSDQQAIQSYKNTRDLNGPADYKTLEKIYGKNKVTRQMMEKFQKNAYGKLIDAKVKSRQDRFRSLRDRKNKINKMSSMSSSPRI